MVSVIVLVSYLDFALTLGAGFGADTVLGAGEQIDSTQRSAASAERGILAITPALGQLTCTGEVGGFGADCATTFALGFAFGGGGLGFSATLTLTVLVMVLVEDEPADPPLEPTQTVTDPEPRLEP